MFKQINKTIIKGNQTLKFRKIYVVRIKNNGLESEYCLEKLCTVSIFPYFTRKLLYLYFFK